jgi:hypothetical protein
MLVKCDLKLFKVFAHNVQKCLKEERRKGIKGKESKQKYTSETGKNSWNPKLMSPAQSSRHVL